MHGQNPYAAGIVALALAFHRAPARHADLLHGRTPLPAGIAVLLKLAGGSPPDPASAALAPADEIRAAALFFVEQVLLRHDASHYRVLGVEPGAPVEAIKEHHRLLMRLFHPDREHRAYEWRDAFATRINLAYTTLHDPAARRRYDSTLKPAPRVPRPLQPAQRGALRARSAEGLRPPLRTHLPQWILAGTALLALLVVASVYVNNPRPPAPGEAEFPRVSATAGLAPEHAAGDEPVTALAAPLRPEPDPAHDAADRESRSVTVPAAPPIRAESELPRRQPQPTAEPLPGEAGTAPGKPAAPTPAPTAAPQPGRLAAPLAPAIRTPAPALQPAATVAPVVQPAPAAPPAAPPDPNATLQRFVASYERGDAPGLMALFDEVAISTIGGKPQIRQAHEALFKSTDLRRIDIEGMTWTREGDWIRGEGRYQTTMMRKGELQLQTESGRIHIELQRRGNQALIMGLDYQPGERS